MRQQEAERERQVKELPGKAAIIKAQAISAKAQTGGNIGGALSGVPPTQMPQIPGNPAGIPGNVCRLLPGAQDHGLSGRNLDRNSSGHVMEK